MFKYAIISAAGMGLRLGNDIPKQFIEVDNEPIFITTLKKFNINCIDKIILAIPNNKKWDKYVDDKLRFFNVKDVDIIYGGSSAEETRWLALNYIKSTYEVRDDDIVVFHDAVRPNVPNELICETVKSCKLQGTAIPYIICKDSMCEICDNRIVAHINNSNKIRLQTPQGFIFKKIYESYYKSNSDKWLGSPILTYSQYYEDINLIYGDEVNFKITTKDDLRMYKKIKV
jgi:2-C-methyl-D-erythritol 4-phosphate cytidylyltransferase